MSHLSLTDRGDITKLKGPVKWTSYSLYVLLDVFSRYVPGWLLAHHESGTLADRLISETVEQEGVTSGLTIHADRGPSMTSKPVALLLADLGIVKSHSRPHVSNDNPFSEAHFKTLKYRPGFPERFGSIEDARAFCRTFFSWYNSEHRHGGIGLLTPEMVHRGRGEQVACCPPGRPDRRLCRAPRAIRAQASRVTETAHRRLDQPAEGERDATESVVL